MNPEEAYILQAWQQNGPQWIRLIEEELIPSRTAVTNDAIIRQVLHAQPKRLLDMGCGEGWLCRALSAHGIACTGVDGVESLISYAKEKGQASYVLASYAALIRGDMHLNGTFDVILFNYSLFGQAQTVNILRAVKAYLPEQGRILIQTIHPQNPLFARKQAQWIEEDWIHFEKQCQAYQWFFRDEAAWKEVFAACDLLMARSESVYLPQSSDPFSIIFELRS